MTNVLRAQDLKDKFDWFETSYTPVTVIDFTIPLTPYQEGSVIFDGQFDFMASQDLTFLEFINKDSVVIISRLLIYLPHPDDMALFGKWETTDNGWYIGYHTNTGNAIEIYWFNKREGNAYILGATDTALHNYKWVMKKTAVDTLLSLYVDDIFQNSRAVGNWTQGNNTKAFTVGHRNAPALSQIDQLPSPATWYAHMRMERLEIHTYQGGIDSFVIYNQNIGGSTYWQDSVTATKSDRTPRDIGDIASWGAHLSNGWTGQAPDSMEAKFSQGQRKASTNVDTLKSGLLFWNNAIALGAPDESFGLGEVSNWNNLLVSVGKHNRVNFTKPPWTDNGDTTPSVAGWNGTTWVRIGGITAFNTNIVVAGVWRDSNLIVGGPFTNAEGLANGDFIVYITPSKTKFDTLRTGTNGDVNCLTTFETDLIVGGSFTTAGGVSTPSKVAKWNGTSWSAMGSTVIGNIFVLRVWNNSLYAGTTTGWWKWNGTSWDAIAGIGGIIYSAVEYLGELVLGGSFLTPSKGLAKYNGSSIYAFADATGFEMNNGASHIVEMKVHPTKPKDLYVNGSFYKIGDVVCNKIARFNGRVWSAINYGLDMRGEDNVFWTNPNTGNLYWVPNGDFYVLDGVKAANIGAVKVP